MPLKRRSFCGFGAKPQITKRIMEENGMCVKKNWIVVVLIAVMSLFVTGCPMEEEVEDTGMKILPPALETEDVPANFWGEWVDFKTGDSWYITGETVKIGSADPAPISGFTLTRQSNRIIQANGSTLLYAVRIANAGFSGAIAAPETAGRSARAIGGMGGIQVIVDNLNDAAQSQTVTTDAGGRFTVPGVIPGDKYKVSAGGQAVVVTPEDGEDIGTITITTGLNFKVSVTHDSDYLYAGKTSSVSISIKNTGTEDATAATYQLSFDSGLSSTSSTTGILGTIEPGRTKKLELVLQCDANSIQGYSAFKTINVRIADPIHNKGWNDSVSLKFYKKEVKLVIIPDPRMGSSVAVRTGWAHTYPLYGVFTTPHGAFQFGASSYSYSRDSADRYTNFFPMTDGNYTLVFGGASADTEMIYSFCIEEIGGDVYFNSYSFNLDFYSSFTDVARYEPNDTEQTATPVTGGRTDAYLHKGDIDYYKFRLR
jgi:hypothetical protein